jgi:NADH dehydrogenase
VAANIAATMGVGTKRHFAYRPWGLLSSLGRRPAVAEICGLKFSGFFAWWLWRTIYLFKLPGLERKVRVALDWTLDLFFPRDIVLLKLFKRQAGNDAPVIEGEISVQSGTASSAP